MNVNGETIAPPREASQMLTTWKLLKAISWLYLSPQTLPEQVAPSSCPTFIRLHILSSAPHIWWIHNLDVNLLLQNPKVQNSSSWTNWLKRQNAQCANQDVIPSLFWDDWNAHWQRARLDSHQRHRDLPFPLTWKGQQASSRVNHWLRKILFFIIVRFSRRWILGLILIWRFTWIWASIGSFFWVRTRPFCITAHCRSHL